MAAYIEKMIEPELMQSFVVLCLISFVFSCLIITVAQKFFNHRFLRDETAIQSAHKGSVPRLGGLAIYGSISIFISISILGLFPAFFPNLNVGFLIWLIVSTIPIFAVGIAEDLGFSMSPNRRLLAAILSGVLVIIIFQVWITRVGILGFDNIISIAPFGIAFTIFATTGVVNAFNLIDGLNGLSSYVSISIAIALSIIAFETNNLQAVRLLFLLSAAVIGFMILNFPFGKIFMGDSGAYTLGHLLVWIAIILVNQNALISPFAILLIFFWPVADTGLAIWRRWKLGNPSDRPDRLHFHQLVMRFLEIRFLGRDRRSIANPLATLILAPLISIPQILALIFWDDLVLTIWIFIASAFTFLMAYMLGMRLAKLARSNNFII